MTTGNHHGRFWIGVSAEPIITGSGDTTPTAPSAKIGRVKPPEDETPGSSIDARQNVRVKVASFICVPPIGSKTSHFPTGDGVTEQWMINGNYRLCSE